MFWWFNFSLERSWLLTNRKEIYFIAVNNQQLLIVLLISCLLISYWILRGIHTSSIQELIIIGFFSYWKRHTVVTNYSSRGITTHKKKLMELNCVAFLKVSSFSEGDWLWIQLGFCLGLLDVPQNISILTRELTNQGQNSSGELVFLFVGH